MWVVIASGKVVMCQTQTEVRKVTAIYPYAKPHYFEHENAALAWIRANQRGTYGTRVKHFGATAISGYISVEYFIDGNNVYYNLFTEKFGKTRIVPDIDMGVVVDNKPNLIKVKVKNLILNDMLIAHHCIAIQRILNIIGEFADVDLILPDMSVYIALTGYKGKDITIRRIQSFIENRLGGVSYTVRDY